jgi:chaperone modulatory protein CbpM
MMKVHAECIRLDDGETVVMAEMVRMSGLSDADLRELVDYGCLPLVGTREEPRFNASVVPTLREAAKLRRAYDLDLFTVGLLLGYLDRISALEAQLRGLQARVAGRLEDE